MIDEMNMLDEIISLAKFSTVDSILFHHNVSVHLISITWAIANLIVLFRIKSSHKILLTLFYTNMAICCIAVFAFSVLGDINSIERRTYLNEQQITLLKKIDDPKLIQVINYNVSQYGKNLYAIDRSLSKTEVTLAEIEKVINPPKFLELKSN